LRIPETNYMEHISVSFKRIKGKTHYYIRQWDANGLNQKIIKNGIIKDGEQMNRLANARTLEDALPDLGSVT